MTAEVLWSLASASAINRRFIKKVRHFSFWGLHYKKFNLWPNVRNPTFIDEKIRNFAQTSVNYGLL